MVLNSKSWESFASVARARERLLLALALTATLLPPLLLQPLALAQPSPVDVLITPGTPEWGKAFEYSVLVRAERSVDVIVVANVYVPGQGWGKWTELWRGGLSAGESKRLSGKDERTPTELGDYVVWVEVLFTSERDYAVIDGRTYYVSWSRVQVVSFAEKEWEKCEEVERDYWRLWQNYTRLENNYTNLELNYTRLKTEYGILKAEYSGLQSKYEWLEWKCRDLNSSYARLKSDYEELKGSYSNLQNSYQRLEDELTIWRAAGLIALGIAIITAVLAVEGWRRALSLAKRIGPAGKG